MFQRNCVTSVWILTQSSKSTVREKTCDLPDETSSLSLLTVSVAWKWRVVPAGFTLTPARICTPMSCSPTRTVLQLVSIMTQSSNRLRKLTRRRPACSQTQTSSFFGVERLCLAEVSFQLNSTGKEAAGSTTLPSG